MVMFIKWLPIIALVAGIYFLISLNKFSKRTKLFRSVLTVMRTIAVDNGTPVIGNDGDLVKAIQDNLDASEKKQELFSSIALAIYKPTEKVSPELINRLKDYLSTDELERNESKKLLSINAEELRKDLNETIRLLEKQPKGVSLFERWITREPQDR
ncbi:hypothetical protein ACI2KR_26905 [Pseudomonas luteola]